VSEHDDLNRVTEQVIAAAIRVHSELGPGMLESAYEACLAFELTERGLSYTRQVTLPLVYRGHRLDCGYRIDLLVEDAVIVEIKAVERIDRVHRMQVLSYLRQRGCKVGLLINFNVRRLVDGVTRIVNGFPDQ
jgi:GxxExxY protein